MAQRKKSEIEFIQDSFCPQVAVLCSYDAEVICRKNALTFVELVQPFCRFNGEIKIIDPSNNSITISNMRVEIKDINYLPPQPLVAKKILDEAVMNGLQSAQSFFERPIATNNYKFSANMNTPWFEQWRDYFIKIGNPDNHEFLKHFLSCIFVVSTSHLDPLDQFQKLILQQQQIQASQSANKSPKWFFPQSANIFKYFVLLHDAQEGEISKAHQIYESLKSTYGPANCHLLQLNSKPVNSSTSSSTSNELDPWLQYCKFNEAYSSSLQNMTIPKETGQADQKPGVEESVTTDAHHPLARSRSNTVDELTSSIDKLNVEVKRHGMCLAASDHDRIKTFISEFLQRGLVPYAERTIKILNEQIQSKKSILKSFGIPRKLFGGSSSSSSSSTLSSASILMSGSKASSTPGASSTSTPGDPGAAGAITITNNFIGTNDDLQLRRLADLAFMFRLYDLAYNSYHSAKKDFTSYLNSNSSQTSSEQVVQTKLYLAGALEMATISSFMQNFAHDLMQAAAASTNNNTTSGGMVNSSSSMHISASSNSLSSLTLNSNKTYQLQYIDEAIGLYVNDCKNLYFSIRSVLLSTEALKATGLFLKAAYQFINLANDETDVRTALFLEQAALCYLAQPQPLTRKYAFFMSLAGHRFSKAGQKRHSLRVYKHALEIYENRGWFKAQDYVNYVSSQLNHRLKDTKEALNHLERIFVKRLSPVTSSSTKSKHDHLPVCIEVSNETNLVKDFILYSGQATQESKQLTPICLPSIDNSNIKVDLSTSRTENSIKRGNILINNDHLVSYDSVSDSDLAKRYKELKDMWQKFEEGLYSAIFNTSVPIMWKPQLTLHDSYSDNKQMPKVVVDETVSILIDLKNNLRFTQIVLSNLTLLWKYVDPSTNEEVANESDETNESTTTLVECSTISEIKLWPNESNRVLLRLTPKKSPGHLHILGLKYKFGIEEDKKLICDPLEAKQMFEVRGARLNNNQQAMRSIVYDVDNRLNFKILPKTAQLQVELDHLPTTMICNQLEKVKIFFINPSHVPIGNVKIASNGISSSHIIFDRESANSSISSRIAYSKSEFKFNDDLVPNDNKNEPMTPKPPIDFIYSLDEQLIEPNGGVCELDMWIRAPEIEDEHTFYLMFAYEDMSESNQQTRNNKSLSSHNNLRYRVIRYAFKIKTTPSISSTNNVTIVESQKNSSLLINLEVSNKQDMHSFELVDLISVSDVWKVSPVKSVDPYVLKQLHADSFSTVSSSSSVSSYQQVRTKINKKTEELISVVVRAEPVKENNNRSEILLFKSNFSNATTSITDNGSMLNQKILVDFIKANVKKNLSVLSNKSCYLDIHLIWRSRETNKFGFTPIKMSTNNYISETASVALKEKVVFNFRHIPEGSKHTVPNQTSKEFSKMARNLIMINHSCESSIQQLPGSMVSLNVNIELENLCSVNQFSLIIFARNAKMNDSKFLWLGSNKKILTLKAKQSRRVQLKLGFTASGIYEIGQLSNEAIVKMNLQDATSVTSFDDIIDDLNLSAAAALNTSTASSNPTATTTDSVVSIYFKNHVNESYELLKLLSPFTVCITK